MPPKAAEFRRIERRILGRTLRDLGFRQRPGVGLSGWAREESRQWLVIWSQLSNWNYGDAPEGYSFTLEFQLSDEPIAGATSQRARFYQLLDDRQRQAHVVLNNQVIGKARPNPLMSANLKPADQRAYLESRGLVPLHGPLDPLEDVWLPYVDESDVEAWMRFLAEVMPSATSRFLERGPWLVW